MIDKNLVIREYNRAAEELLGAEASERIGSKAVVITRGTSPVFEVMQTGKPRFNVMSPLSDGRIFSVNYVPMLENGNVVGVSSDIPRYYRTRGNAISTPGFQR
jgi:sensor histidine kinase regulating citrate/malate metabolism